MLAQTQPIFGPFTFKLPSTNLISVSDSFNVPASATGPYLLRVRLSAPNSLNTLSLKLNNVQVLSLGDFSGGKTQVDKTVVLQPHNTFSLQLKGKKNTRITVTLFATPNLPKPTSLTPNPLAITAGASGNLTATLSPPPAAAGTLAVSSANGSVAAVPASVPFASGQAQVVIPVSGVSAGSTSVTASLNGGSASATVSVALALPSIFGQTPKDVTLSGASLPLIAAQYSSTGSAIDLNSVRLRLDGQDITPLATVTETTVFYQVTQPLAVAAHTVSVTAANVAGGTTTATWSFTLDEPAPSFFSESPRDVFVADRQPRIRVLLSGFNIVPSSVRIQLDGADVTAQSDVGTGHIIFTPAAPLADGNHTVSVTATDGRGAIGGKQWSFTVELPPPPSVTDDGTRTERTVVPEITVLP